MNAARVMKEHDERRGEILDAAQLLFNSQGYDSTSVNAIIEHLGISKGTFYHYFSSKEDLIAGIAERDRAQSCSELHGTGPGNARSSR